MSGSWIWPAVCLGIGFALIVVEVFIPSGGLIGISAALFLAVAIWLAFSVSSQLGIVFLSLTVVLLPVAIVLAVQIWPKTPMGKWMILMPPKPDDVEPETNLTQGTRLEHLIGQFGKCLTPLRPSGTVEMDGRRIDGLAEEGMIPAGALVKAVQVRGGQIVFREAVPEALDDWIDDPELIG